MNIFLKIKRDLKQTFIKRQRFIGCSRECLLRYSKHICIVLVLPPSTTRPTPSSPRTSSTLSTQSLTTPRRPPFTQTTRQPFHPVLTTTYRPHGFSSSTSSRHTTNDSTTRHYQFPHQPTGGTPTTTSPFAAGNAERQQFEPYSEASGNSETSNIYTDTTLFYQITVCVVFQ